jgi:hypothetical protein
MKNCMRGKCSAQRRNKSYEVLLAVVGKIILKCILKEQGVNVLNGLDWLMIGPNGVDFV